LARKILLADDSVTAQNMGRKILADAGYEVITVNNGSAALKKIAELKPDLVILDVYMPGYSGLEVCQRLKESQESSRIPVLLTVGKLEPFKPEEAQRVRAEGFIVKPFEASELLAALSKLEDKVVPRSEPSKPGRFARAIAAAEETVRISRNDAAGDDGWKSRISFPHEKTEQEKIAEEAPPEVNRALRTVVGTDAEKPAEKKKEEEKQPGAENSVDVAALVPEGLPKDVTAEEVAAIAAAAAQIHLVAASAKDASAKDEPSGSESSPTVEHAAHPVAEPPASVVANSSATLIAEEKPVVAENVVIENRSTEKQESAAAETYAVETGPRPEAEEKPEESQDVPVTMAATTGSMRAESMGAANESGPRWTAVSVALEADEAAISLDQEMQKAYAAFVAEETAPANARALPETTPAESISAAVQGAPAGETEKPADAISNPVPESSSRREHIMNPAPAETEAPLAAQTTTPPPEAFVAPVSESVPESAPESGLQAEATFVAPLSSELVPEKTEPAKSSEVAERGFAEPSRESFSEVVNEAATGSPELTVAPESEAAMAVTMPSASAFAPIVRAEPAKEQNEQPKEESETVDVKSSAAAWANWRQIRDTSDPKAAAAESGREEFEQPAAASIESAAMAVAAGAEQSGQETATQQGENPGDVASIVDSVLADLRPRLMAEITRKMAEKK